MCVCNINDSDDDDGFFISFFFSIFSLKKKNTRKGLLQWIYIQHKATKKLKGEQKNDTTDTRSSPILLIKYEKDDYSGDIG